MLLYQIQKELIKEEGIRLEKYVDSLGNATIGVGHLLYDEPIEFATLEQVGKWLTEDIKIAIDSCSKKIPLFNELDEKRQYVLISMAFNLGIAKLLKFKKMLLALENRNYAVASKEMLDSKWARQVKTRATKLANIMRSGVII